MASIIKSTAVVKLPGSSRAGRACAMAAVLGYWPAGRVRYWISQDSRSASG